MRAPNCLHSINWPATLNRMSLALLAVSKLFLFRRQVLGFFGLPVWTLSVGLPVLTRFPVTLKQ